MCLNNWLKVGGGTVFLGLTTRNQNTLLDTEGARSEAPGDVNDNSVIQVGK